MKGIATAIIAAACISGALLLFATPEGKSAIASLLGHFNDPVKSDTSKDIFAPLNVVDDSRAALNFSEQKALFNGFSDNARDPMSIQVRALVRGGKYAVCGEVNAKNGFGGYVGFVPFVATLVPEKAVVITYDKKELGDTYEYRVLVADAYLKMGCDPARR